ncbi:MAG: ABC transporter ATP-binding protein [Actinobacteria bacterium]|nr:ABC transporter ATP-binding protein [Actinomycetota bacterium]
MSKDVIRIDSVDKVFTTNGSKKKRSSLQVLADFSISVKEGELFCLLGPSGCGKSTILRIIAGLESPTTGDVWVYGRSVSDVHDMLGMVFQEPTLLPWRTIEGNVYFGLEERRVPKAERKEKVSEYLELVGLEGFEHHYPQQLSGGMRQRAALAATLANKPKVLLLDEPFGALDALTRLVMQQELLRILERAQLTVVLVTHSIDEAVFLADRIAIVSPRPGKVESTIVVDIPRPRDRTDPRFAKLSQEIFELVVGEAGPNGNGVGRKDPASEKAMAGGLALK